MRQNRQKGRFPVETKRKLRARTVVLIVLAVILLLLCAALAVAGNFLFDFALNPSASLTMGGLLQGGGVEGIGDGPTGRARGTTSAWAGWSGPMC